MCLDEYFKYKLDVNRNLVLRIRKKSNGENLLTFKGSSQLKEDIAWQEWETKIEDSSVLKKLLLSNGLITVVVINKKRKSYRLENLEINIDNIDGLGTFIEIEIIHTNVDKGRSIIEEFLFEKLKLNSSSIITKGYVALMLEKNKKSKNG